MHRALSAYLPAPPVTPAAVRAAPHPKRRDRDAANAGKQRRSGDSERPSRSYTPRPRTARKRRALHARPPLASVDTAPRPQPALSPVAPSPTGGPSDKFLIDSPVRLRLAPVVPVVTPVQELEEHGLRQVMPKRKRKSTKPDQEPSDDAVSGRCTIYSHNVQMKKLEKRKDLPACLRLLAEIRERRLSPDKYTYSILLSCCARTSAVDVAVDLYNCMKAENVPVDNYIRTNLLTVAASSTPPRLDMCTLVFRSTPKPSRVMCNVMMNAFARSGRIDDCLTTYRYMALRNMQADRYTVSAMVKAYVTAGRLDDAVDKIHEMHAAGLEVSSVAFGQVMDAFGKIGAMNKAVDLFDSMTLYGVQPSQITYNILIGACSHVSQVGRAFEIYEEMKATSSFSGDRYTLHSLMKCCLRVMDGHRALALYRSIKKSTFPCNQVSYRLALIAAGQLIDLDAVLEVADDITAHKVKPRDDTAAVLVAAAIRCSDLESALQFFSEYVKHSRPQTNSVRFFDAMREALKSFETFEVDGNGDFEFTSLVVDELQRSWQRGL